MCNSTSDGFGTLCCDSSNDARGNACSTTTKIGRKYTEILHFPIYFPHFRFVQNEEGWDEKQFSDFCTVRILVQLGTGNTTKKKKKRVNFRSLSFVKNIVIIKIALSIPTNN